MIIINRTYVEIKCYVTIYNKRNNSKIFSKSNYFIIPANISIIIKT